LEPLNICEARNFKYDTKIGHCSTNEKNAKLGQHGRAQGHVAYFFKFCNPSKAVRQTIRKQ